MRLPGRRSDPRPVPPVAHADDARVVVYSRAGCHLCEEAEAQVAQICGESGDTWVRIDIDTDPDLRQRFTEQVPVTFVDGAQHDFWRVDPKRLRTALSRPR
ncbi:glutaredoxin family protein [Aeromicrobium sp. P5_D10]